MQHYRRKGTFWSRTLDIARQNSTWTEVPRAYSARTARRLASEIRTSHRRQRGHLVNVVRTGERWDAVCKMPANKSEAAWNCKVILRLVEQSQN